MSLADAATLRARDPQEYVRAANASIVEHVAAMLALKSAAP